MEEIKPKIITPFIFENITTQNLTFSYFLPGAARQTIAALHLIRSLLGGRMMVSTEEYSINFCYVCWELRAIFHVNSSKKFLSFVLTITMATLLLSVGML